MISMACIWIVKRTDCQLFDSVVLRDLLGPIASSQTKRQTYTDRQADKYTNIDTDVQTDNKHMY